PPRSRGHHVSHRSGHRSVVRSKKLKKKHPAPKGQTKRLATKDPLKKKKHHKRHHRHKKGIGGDDDAGGGDAGGDDDEDDDDGDNGPAGEVEPGEPVDAAVTRPLPNTEPEAKASVELNVRVPASAIVWVDTTQTQLTGTFRQFVTPPLAPGQNYAY